MGDMLKDNDGKPSSMRLMAFISLLTSIWFGYLAIKLKSDFGVYLSITFLLSAYVGKNVQKFIELAKPPINK